MDGGRVAIAALALGCIRACLELSIEYATQRTTIVLIAVAFAPWPLGYFDAVYGVASLVLGGAMLALAVNVYRCREGSEARRATRKLFAFSILYLFGLFATLLLEVVVRALAPTIW